MSLWSKQMSKKEKFIAMGTFALANFLHVFFCAVIIGLFVKKLRDIIMASECLVINTGPAEAANKNSSANRQRESETVNLKYKTGKAFQNDNNARKSSVIVPPKLTVRCDSIRSSSVFASGISPMTRSFSYNNNIGNEKQTEKIKPSRASKPSLVTLKLREARSLSAPQMIPTIDENMSPPTNMDKFTFYFACFV
ncbi:hypothetical protein RFI_20994 [Reticulomyxa filosa]|uniref:Uncharacterized protein n=1 Tax=Reticulomyxa filosa TaxID=46433 RepID=X6MTE4_RETFI|nr:hypothetical protein RFI_20994 [Reticulomyxa filosa]|eukprot:ETO16360.1 hypothetical protein RFI_20994 [Reticulomyxa filosa]